MHDHEQVNFVSKVGHFHVLYMWLEYTMTLSNERLYFVATIDSYIVLIFHGFKFLKSKCILLLLLIFSTWHGINWLAKLARMAH